MMSLRFGDVGVLSETGFEMLIPALGLKLGGLLPTIISHD